MVIVESKRSLMRYREASKAMFRDLVVLSSRELLA